ncbi:unnamed protein product [Paramecium sonneborni]|uniref:Uncharacterized protein n=1 Tax=Paramecium sonneborni TaxID=65129 RepID=A0A8S1MYK9_9CILI|nr:unnamed protein product [Paramecium sonneborni]
MMLRCPSILEKSLFGFGLKQGKCLSSQNKSQFPGNIITNIIVYSIQCIMKKVRQQLLNLHYRNRKTQSWILQNVKSRDHGIIQMSDILKIVIT